MLSLQVALPPSFPLASGLGLVADQARALSDRVRTALARAQDSVAHIRAAQMAAVSRLRRAIVGEPPQTTSLRVEAELLDEPLTWALATLPLAESGTSLSQAMTLHRSAGEQLEAVAYGLAQMRRDLGPIMKYAPIRGSEPVALHGARFETSLEALLALSRANAATRPKERVETAA